MKILVVDDAKTLRHILSKVLNELGYTQILEAGSAGEAKTVLARENIDLIISDWHMPGESGLDLLHFVRGNPQYAPIPFIMNTTENEKKNIFEAVKGGVQSYMFKPVQKEILAQKLQEIALSHGIQAPLTAPGAKVKNAPVSGTDISQKDTRESIIITSNLDINKKGEIVLDGCPLSIILTDITSGALPDAAAQILPGFRIALLTDIAPSAEALNDLKKKYEIKIMVKI